MTEIKDVAAASWRLEKWVAKSNESKKMAAEASLRCLKEYLTEQGVEYLDLTGSRYNSGLSVEVIRNEAEGIDEENLIIVDMVKPVVQQNGAVIAFGQAVLGERMPETAENEAAEAEKPRISEKDRMIAEVLQKEVFPKLEWKPAPDGADFQTALLFYLKQIPGFFAWLGICAGKGLKIGGVSIWACLKQAGLDFADWISREAPVAWKWLKVNFCKGVKWLWKWLKKNVPIAIKWLGVNLWKLIVTIAKAIGKGVKAFWESCAGGWIRKHWMQEFAVIVLLILAFLIIRIEGINGQVNQLNAEPAPVVMTEAES